MKGQDVSLGSNSNDMANCHWLFCVCKVTRTFQGARSFFFLQSFGGNHAPNSFHWSLKSLFSFLIKLLISRWVCNTHDNLSQREKNCCKSYFYCRTLFRLAISTCCNIANFSIVPNAYGQYRNLKGSKDFECPLCRFGLHMFDMTTLMLNTLHFWSVNCLLSVSAIWPRVFPCESFWLHMSFIDWRIYL